MSTLEVVVIVKVDPYHHIIGILRYHTAEQRSRPLPASDWGDDVVIYDGYVETRGDPGNAVLALVLAIAF